MVGGLAEDEPVLDPTLLWIWRAWHRLTDDRPYHGGGMGPAVPGRIPWSLVHLWAQHHQLERGAMAMLDACFAELDTVYLTWWVAQQPKADE